jgi:hypothetical protein
LLVRDTKQPISTIRRATQYNSLVESSDRKEESSDERNSSRCTCEKEDD